MHDLSHDDDVLSDILIDNLGYECALSTHKMNPSYRPQRVHASLVRDLVWNRVIVDLDVTAAVEELCLMGVVKKYIADKDKRQMHAFRLHAKRYFEAYHPDSGIEFVQSTRYRRASTLLKQAAAAGVRIGAAPSSPRASTSAVQLSDPVSTSAPAPSNTAAVKVEEQGSTDASHDRVSAPGSEQANGTVDVVMRDESATTGASANARSDAPNDGPAGSTAVPPSNATGVASDLNGHKGPPVDIPGTGASTPSSTSGTSKGKRRALSENAKGKMTQQLATSWSDPFATHEKADMAVVAIKAYKPGDFIDGLKGGVKDLTREEDEAMKIEAAAARERLGPGQIAATAAPARDFSVIRSAQKACSQLLLGPARFVNHDCNPNVEFYRSGHSILFRCTRPIMPKDEITCYYGPNYFELGNAECLCATCEANGKGAFSNLAGTSFSTNLHHLASPDMADGDMTGFSPGPEGSASSANSVNGSDTSANGVAATSHGSRRASARVASIQASGRPKRMTPGGVPFPSMSTAPMYGGSAGPSVSRRLSPSSDTNMSSTSAAEVDGGIGLGVGLPTSGTSMHPNLGLGPPPFAQTASSKGKVVHLTCRTCQDRFEWHATWFAPQECTRCIRHEKIYRAPWPNRKAEEALEKRRIELEKKLEFEHLRRVADGERDRKAKKARTSKSRSDPTRMALDDDASTAGAKGKQRATASKSALASESSTFASASTSADSDSDSDLTELASSDNEASRAHPRHGRDNPVDNGAADVDADATLDGQSSRTRRRNGTEAKSSNLNDGSDVLSGSFADYKSRYGPTGKAPRTALDFQARRREKPEPPWTKADEEDRRRSTRRKSRPTRSTLTSQHDSSLGSTRRSRRGRRDDEADDAASSSSSSRSSSPAGPPVLGKDANLQNLADFWGATDGERRVRKPVLAGGVTSLLERQRAESSAKRRAREREEAKMERRRMADRRRRKSENGTEAHEHESIKLASSSRGSRSSNLTKRRSLDSSLADQVRSKTARLAGSGRASTDASQPRRSSNRQALKRDRLLATDGNDRDGDDEGEELSDEDSDFNASDATSTSDDDEQRGGDSDDVDQASGSRRPSNSRVDADARRSKRSAPSSDGHKDHGESDSSDGSQPADRSAGSSQKRSKKKRFVFSRSSSPLPAIPGLATKGPERTSNANLALAWSAGIGEGTKRTRKPVHREPVSVAQAAGGRRSPSVAESTGRSRTSETPKPSMPSRASDRTRERSTSDAGQHERDRARRARTSPGTAGAQSNKGRQSVPTAGSRSSSSALTGLRTDGRGPPTTLMPGKLVAGQGASQRVLGGSTASPLPPLAGGPAGAALDVRRYSASSTSNPGSPVPILHGLPSPANPPVPGFRRPASPAGASLTLAPAHGAGSTLLGAGSGAVPLSSRGPGAPRKNLRWGSGKVSHSRPSPHLAGVALPPTAGAVGGGGGGGTLTPATTPLNGTTPGVVRPALGLVKTDVNARSPAASPTNTSSPKPLAAATPPSIVPGPAAPVLASTVPAAKMEETSTPAPSGTSAAPAASAPSSAVNHADGRTSERVP